MEGESGENETESSESSNQFEVLDEYEPSSGSTKKRTNKTEIGCHTALFTSMSPVPWSLAWTEQNAADAIYAQLEQWALMESIQAMSFDTTSVNTGRFNRNCKLELTSSTDDFRENTVSFLTNFVDLKSQVRDDYEELIELTMIILGDPPKTIHWRAPGPVHHARWMAKLIYAIKIYLFRHQKEIFSLTAKEESQLKRFVQFGALLYTKSWIQAPCAAEAPGGDLWLWKNLQQYQSIDHDMSIAAQKILQNHMCYLSDETVSLALFSDEVSPIEKQKIITGFGIEPSERHVRGDPSLLQIEDVSLGHFSTRRSQNLLTKLQIGHSFLVLPPEQWNDNTYYQKAY
ncbi:hypothetical protein Bpfe_001210 [Biomphalaria pfeifferi]|uniref:Uncharacterized protein n=1 Tax=Biomphalaria pfeifferi TaxID=112525 RepID=A0AAD8CAC4_BIOPF|nr:hypothetical protein Bpfe_001210 [Biomphalaria pfeifferi]